MRLSARSCSGTSSGSAGVDHDLAHEAPASMKPGMKPAVNSLSDRDVGEHPVDDHDVRRRDEKAERAGTREAADRDVLVIAAPQQLGERDAADHLRGRGRRAGDRREDRAADDVDVQQPPRQQSGPWREPGNSERDRRDWNKISPIRMNIGSESSSCVVSMFQAYCAEQLVERDVAEDREQHRADRAERKPDPDAPGSAENRSANIVPVMAPVFVPDRRRLMR